MSAVAKGELAVIDRNGRATETIPVQFNPTTLSIQMTNSTDGAQSRGRQRQQYNGSASTTLTLDLEFDTADEGTSANPVDVRTRTAKVAQFVLPGGTETKQAPPRVRFTWGTFELTGVMDSLSEELSFFSADGVPLRSKLSVSIKEQDARFEALETGPGANAAPNAPAAGEASNPVTTALDRVAEALSGETPADFLARNGLAPEAWRALGGALDALGDGIELEAGLSVGFSADLSLGVGLGVSVGFQAAAGLSVESSLGLAPLGARSSARSQGIALAAAGGVSAASEQAKAAEGAAAATASRAAFGGGEPTAPAPTRSTASTTDRAPLAGTPSWRRRPAAPAPPPVIADQRATTWGHGVPLRDRITAADQVASTVTTAGSASTSPWTSLAPTPSQAVADRAQRARAPSCGCHRCDPGGHR